MEHAVRMCINAISAGNSNSVNVYKEIAFLIRAINYDERDPFLCNSCGYSKYAKFETTVSGKSCAAVDPIENEEDRKKVSIPLPVVLLMWA